MWRKFAVGAPLCLSIVISAAAADATILEKGGSNYVAIDLQPASLLTKKDWQNSSLFRTPACQLNKFPEKAKSDLRSMQKNGQRKIALILWHAHISGVEPCRGYLLNSTGATFKASVIANILRFLQIAKNSGFDEVEVRFAPQWINNPRNWKKWNDGLYRENVGVINQTISAIKKKNILPVVFDLGAELGGLENSMIVEKYVKSVWSQMQSDLTVGGSYGFSVAYAPGRLGRLIAWLRGAGRVPSEFGLDIYKDPARLLEAATREARKAGVAQPMFLIQETYYDDASVYQAFVSAARSAHVVLRAIVQWPLSAAAGARRGRGSQISEPGTQLFSYRPAP